MTALRVYAPSEPVNRLATLAMKRKPSADIGNGIKTR